MKKRCSFLGWDRLAYLLVSMVLISCNGSERTDKAGKTTAGCQPDVSYPVLPHMYCDKNESIKQEQNYTGRFDGLLSGALGGNRMEADSFYYDTTAFLGMGAAFLHAGCGLMRVCFAVYDAAGKPYVPSGQEGKMLLLYSPVDANGNQAGYYRLLDSATSFSLTDNRIPDSIANRWIGLYTTVIIPFLNPYLDAKDSYNYVNHDTKTSLLNTLSVLYFVTDLMEVRAEVAYQASQNQDTIIGFKAFFSNMPQSTAGDKALSNRLKINFEFVQKGGTEFYLESTPDFSCRKQQPGHFPDNGKSFLGPQWRHLMGLDNGNMCPPTCNN